MITEIKNKLKNDPGLNQLVSGGAVSFLMQGGGMLLGYVLMAVIANYFGVKILGVYSFSYTVLMLAVILSTLGLDIVIIKIAGKRDNNSAIGVLVMIYKIVVPVALVLGSVIIIIGSMYFDMFFDEVEYKRYLIIAGVSLLLSVVLTINIEYLRASGNILISEFLRNIFRPIASLITIIVIQFYQYDIYSPSYALLLASGFACVFSICWIFCRGQYENKYPLGKQCDESIKSLIENGAPIQASMLAFYLISNMVIFFVSGYQSSIAVGLMLVSIKLAGLINMPLMVLNKVCAPRFSKLYWGGHHNELQLYIGQVSKIAFFLAVFASVFIIVFAEHLLAIFGKDFIDAKPILFILVVGQLVSCASGSVGIFMMMTGNEVAYRNLAAIIAALSFVAYYFVLPEYGIFGAACTLACSQALLNVSAVIYIKRQLGFVTMYIPFGRKLLS